MSKAALAIAQLEKAARKSRAQLPAHLLFFLVTLVVALVLRRYFEIGRFLLFLLLWVGPFMILVDTINIVYCRWRIARLRRG